MNDNDRELLRGILFAFIVVFLYWIFYKVAIVVFKF